MRLEIIQNKKFFCNQTDQADEVAHELLNGSFVGVNTFMKSVFAKT